MAKYAIVTSTAGKLTVNSAGDGVTHINIYSHGLTDLGRKLSNFAHNPFTHPEFGRFESMEGYWYWLVTGRKHDLLRTKIAFDAKSYGRTKPRVKDDDFERHVKEGLHCMLRDNPAVYDGLLKSTLPLTHYYSYTNTLKDNPGSLFLLKEFDLLRHGKPLSA